MSLYTKDSIDRREGSRGHGRAGGRANRSAAGRHPLDGALSFPRRAHAVVLRERRAQALPLLRLSASGDAIEFVQETEGLDFREAVELLAERYSVELKREKEDPPRSEAAAPGAAAQARGAHAAYYERYLWESSEAAKRRASTWRDAASRSEVLRDFRVGYAPSAWDQVTGRRSARRLQPRGARGGRARAAGPGRLFYDASAPGSCSRWRTSRGKVLGFGAEPCARTRARST